MKLNADLGEHEPPGITEALMELIDMANIACGRHAGTPETMARCVALAIRHSVLIGAHPGLVGDFGRGGANLTAGDLASLVRGQTEALTAVAAEHGTKLHHIKLHGALYHAVESSAVLAAAYVDTVRTFFPSLTLVAFAAGQVLPHARALGVPVLAEVFAERGYRPDGSLIPRGEPGDLIEDPQEVTTRLPSLKGDTICVHADSPNALTIARAVRAALR